MANEDKAARYHRLRRRAAISSAAVGALFLAVLLVSGGSAALRDAVTAAAGGSRAVAIVLYVLIMLLGVELFQAPLAYYEGVVLERRYGLSRQTTRGWWRDYVKAGALSLLFASVAALIVFSLIAWDPARWWIAAAVVFSILLVGLAQLAPLLILPLFYDIKPLEREDLARRLVALAGRAGTRVAGVFEWRLSDRTRKANAAFTGLGRTRRILLSDTLLAEYSEDEMEVILAHELAHQVHRDVWSGIALEAGLIAVAFFAADLALGAAGGSFGLLAKADVAALPLIALCVGASSVGLRPLANALSRAHERRADRYALEMTRNPGAFVTAMKRLAAQNLAEERPSRAVEWLFYTHPPTIARIEAARAWAATQAPTT